MTTPDNEPIYIVRLYNCKCEHVASLLPCGTNSEGKVTNWDLANPDGKVFYCGVDCDLVDTFAELLGWETI